MSFLLLYVIQNKCKVGILWFFFVYSRFCCRTVRSSRVVIPRKQRSRTCFLLTTSIPVLPSPLSWKLSRSTKYHINHHHYHHHDPHQIPGPRRHPRLSLAQSQPLHDHALDAVVSKGGGEWLVGRPKGAEVLQ
jgi:hypothetical protein